MAPPPRERTNATVERIVEEFKGMVNRLLSLARSDQWPDLFLYAGVLFFVLFAPEYGALFAPVNIFIQSHDSIDLGIYSKYFFTVISILFLLYVFCQLIKLAKKSMEKSMGWRRALLLMITTAIFLAMVSNYLYRFPLVPDTLGNDLSWGEESLFANRVEAFIYENNRNAISEHASSYLTIAVSLPVKRQNGIFHSEEILRGVAIAQNEWNQKNTRNKIVVVIADDGYSDNSERARIAILTAEKLVDREEVLGVIGHFSSDATEAASKVYKKHQLVSISPTSTAVRCDSSGNSGEARQENGDQEQCANLGEYVFRTAVDDSIAALTLVNYIKANPNLIPIDKVLIAYESENVYSKSFKDVFAKKFETNGLGEVIRYVGDAPLDPCNASRGEAFDALECLDYFVKDEDSSPNALLLIPSTGDTRWVGETIIELGKINAERARNGKNAIQLLGSDSMYQENLISINGIPREETAGMLIPITWHRTKTTQEECNDLALLECKAGWLFRKKASSSEEPPKVWKPLGINWRTATAYDAAQVLIYALDKATEKCTLIDSIVTVSNPIGKHSCIRENIQGIIAENLFEDNPGDIPTSSGQPIEFSNGDIVKGFVRVVQAQGNSFVTVF